MGKLFIGNKAVGEFDAARVTGQHIQLKNFVSFDAAPQLNENQQLLLQDLRGIKEYHKEKNLLGLVWVLGQRFTTKSDIKAFTNQEILDAMRALEQEEE
ncbi:hypothetical protein [Enterococcus entomosocium]|uniref:hypothetical protein n=1 Tax=Enterococcus entomosocium TaxID=3034352 RepID=UPI002648AEBE|nr:hypothetical protein [Enterococcus entomosocium]